MSIETYRQGLRSAVRGLWMGVLDFYGFYQSMQSAIGREINKAWAEGAAEGGITPDEYSDEEQRALQAFLTAQYQAIQPFGLAIVANSRAKSKPLQPLLNRVELWVNRYEEATNKARALALADQKLMWRLGPTKEHCGSCRNLNGKVKRGSYWTQHAILPRSSGLECGGYNCKCSLMPTKEKCTPGPLPKFM